MPEGRQVGKSNLEQLGGPQYSYDSTEQQFEIRIPIGEIKPEEYTLQTYPKGGLLEVGPSPTRSSGGVVSFTLSPGSVFVSNFISSTGYIGGEDTNEFVIHISLPEGIRSSVQLEQILNNDDYPIGQDVLISLSDDLLEGSGLENLQEKAGLTDFETELVRCLLTDAVSRFATTHEFDFNQDMILGMVNVLAEMMKTELLALGGPDD